MPEATAEELALHRDVARVLDARCEEADQVLQALLSDEGQPPHFPHGRLCAAYLYLLEAVNLLGWGGMGWTRQPRAWRHARALTILVVDRLVTDPDWDAGAAWERRPDVDPVGRLDVLGRIRQNPQLIATWLEVVRLALVEVGPVAAASPEEPANGPEPRREGPPNARQVLAWRQRAWLVREHPERCSSGRTIHDGLLRAAREGDLPGELGAVIGDRDTFLGSCRRVTRHIERSRDGDDADPSAPH